MALIPYLSAGDQLTAEAWNTLFEEADAKLAANNDSKPIAYWGTPVVTGLPPYVPLALYTNRFYFLSEWGNWGTPGSIHYNTWGNLSGHSLPDRLYDHTVFTDFITAAAVCDDLAVAGGWTLKGLDATWPAARLDLADADDYLDVWEALLFPDTTGTHTTAQMRNILDHSLEAHKKTVSGTDYWAFVNGSSITPSRTLRYQGAEIIIGNTHASITFPANWNRFNVFRFNNLQAISCTINFTGYSITIPAESSKCVRRTAAGTYVEGWNYLQQMLPGDPWSAGGSGKFTGAPTATGRSLSWASDCWNNILDPFCAARLAAHFKGDTELDASQAWDVSTFYADYFNAIQDGNLLADLFIHKGKVLVINPTNLAKTEINVTSASQLFTALSDAGVTTSEDANGELKLTAAASRDLISWSSNAPYVFGCGKPVITAGPSVQPYLPSMLTHGMYGATSADRGDGTMRLKLLGLFGDPDYATKYVSQLFNFKDTVGDMLGWYNNTRGLASTVEAYFALTIHGPALYWRQEIEVPNGVEVLEPGAPGYIQPWNVRDYFTWKEAGVLQREGSALFCFQPIAAANDDGKLTDHDGNIVDLGWFISKYSWDNTTYSPGSLTTYWDLFHTPRKDRLWAQCRVVRHTPNDFPFYRPGYEPWDVSGSPVYAGQATGEHPFVKEYFDVKPLTEFTLSAETGLRHKAGIRFLSRYDNIADIYFQLASFLNQTLLAWTEPYGTGSRTRTADFQVGATWATQYYTAWRNNLLANTPVNNDPGGSDAVGIAFSLLPMQVEHYNGAASMVNMVVESA